MCRENRLSEEQFPPFGNAAPLEANHLAGAARDHPSPNWNCLRLDGDKTRPPISINFSGALQFETAAFIGFAWRLPPGSPWRKMS
jgi:hypothetical protein